MFSSRSLAELPSKLVTWEAKGPGSRGFTMSTRMALTPRTQVATFATISDSTYNALQVQARFSSWHRLSGFSAYVFSKSLDGASDGIDFNGSTAAFPQDSDNLKA